MKCTAKNIEFVQSYFVKGMGSASDVVIHEKCDNRDKVATIIGWNFNGLSILVLVIVFLIMPRLLIVVFKVCAAVVWIYIS